MTLELGGEREHVSVELEQVIGGHQPGDDRRGARPESARQRDVRRDPELEPVGRMEPLERPHHEVVAAARHVEVGDDRERPGLDHLELEMQRERRGEHVEPRP